MTRRIPFAPGAVLPLFLIVSTSAGCSSGQASSSNDACSQIAIDRFKELIVVDDAVISDSRALNATDGAWSFRNAIEQMTPPGESASDFVLSWLTEWGAIRQFNGYPLDSVGEYRDTAMNSQVICPWLQLTPSNGCNADCSTCTSKTLDMAQAPFKLLAIVNRIDLRVQPNEGIGEARLVFGLRKGPADLGSPPMPMTVNFEYGLPSSRSLVEWAKTWHALGSFGQFDDSFKTALQAVTDAYVSRNAEPSNPNGNALHQLRTNESALDWIWQLRQFNLSSTDGMLHTAGTVGTPSASFNATDTLTSFINGNVDAIRAGYNPVPDYMSAGSIAQLLFTWSAPGVTDDLRKDFAKNTCNGCHSEEVPSIDTAFHVSPFRSGTDKVSPFLNDTTGRSVDELTRRSTSMQQALCGH